MLISNAAIDRRSTVFALLLIIVVTGVYSYVVLPRESSPDITIPYVMVVTTYNGVSPGDIESLITHPLERELKGVKDIKEMTSVSAEGASSIVIEFDPSVDIDTALQKVRDKVDQAKPDLPADLENDPSINEINISEFPIMMVSVSGDKDEVVLKAVAEELQDRIEQLPGVLEAVLSGGLERQILVEFDPDRLYAYKISLAEVMAAIAQENVNIPGGSIDIGEGKYLLRVPGEFTDPAQIDNLVLTQRDGKIVYFKDVANIVDGFEDRTSYARFNGRQSVSLGVKKRTGANIIEVSDQVFELINEAEKLLPDGIELSVTSNQAKDIRRMVKELENSIITGLILVVVVLFIFLGLRNSFFVALAIPFSMLLSFGVINLLGITLNMVVLFSLILALGMLVDNAIVIVENVYRHMEEGHTNLNASKIAVTEVGWPVITSTLTTLCAFFPMTFWPGIMGQFMMYLPITLIITLTASLFVALVINPTLCGHFMTLGKKRDFSPGRILRLYGRFLVFALRHRIVTVFASFGLLVIICVTYGIFGHGVEFMPNIEPNSAYVEITAPEGTNLDASDRLARKVEALTLVETDVLNTIVESGTSESGGGSTQSNLAKVSLDFVDRHARKENSSDVLDRLRSLVAPIAGAEFKVEKLEEGPPTGPPVNIEISGDDIKTLSQLTADARTLIDGTPGMVDLKDDFSKAKPEIRVDVDREKASLLNLSTYQISEMVKAAIGGTKLGVYREGEDEYDIIARMPQERRTSVADVENLLIPATDGVPVPLSTIATISLETGYGSIRHIDQKRVVTISAETFGRNSNEVLLEVQQRLSTLELPAGYTITYSGEQEDQQEAAAFLSKAFIGAVLLIMLVLVTQFNSALQTFIVMTSVLLSLTGVFLGLMISGTPFGIIMTGIGVISLAGVVVNNAIVLIDYINQLITEGMDISKALVRAGMVRFRPVLLTAATTILGLLPMALKISIDFTTLSFETGSESGDWWSPMAVAVIFGLAFATVLTLIVVPVLYSLAYSLRTKFGSKAAKVKTVVR
jgi:CzcA family heavy metal efflux pump